VEFEGQAPAKLTEHAHSLK